MPGEGGAELRRGQSGGGAGPGWGDLERTGSFHGATRGPASGSVQHGGWAPERWEPGGETWRRVAGGKERVVRRHAKG